MHDGLTIKGRAKTIASIVGLLLGTLLSTSAHGLEPLKTNPTVPPLTQHRVNISRSLGVSSGSTCDCAYEYDANYVLGIEWDYLARTSQSFRMGVGARWAYGRSKPDLYAGKIRSENIGFLMFLFGPYTVTPAGNELELLLGIGLTFGRINVSDPDDPTYVDMSGLGGEASLNYVYSLGRSFGLLFGLGGRMALGAKTSAGYYNGVHGYLFELLGRTGVRW